MLTTPSTKLRSMRTSQEQEFVSWSWQEGTAFLLSQKTSNITPWAEN